MLELDGRTLEGGGQLVRNSVCLAALTQTPLRITHIRGKRPGGGGLKAQHVACVRWLAAASGATLTGGELGSTELTFQPRPESGEQSSVWKPGVRHTETGPDEPVYTSRLDIGTSGATTLALQAILPYLLCGAVPEERGIVVTLTGGTNVGFAPSFDYVQLVLLPTLQELGWPEMTVKLDRRGWSSGRGGAFSIYIPARAGAKTRVQGFRHAPALHIRGSPPRPRRFDAVFLAPAAWHASSEDALRDVIGQAFGFTGHEGEAVPLHLRCEDTDSDKRVYLILTATCEEEADERQTYVLGSDTFRPSRKQVREEVPAEMARMVCAALVREWASGAWADEHLRDQLVVFQGLADGISEVYGGAEVEGSNAESEEATEKETGLRAPSLHTRTAEFVKARFLKAAFDGHGGCEGRESGDGQWTDVAGDHGATEIWSADMNVNDRPESWRSGQKSKRKKKGGERKGPRREMLVEVMREDSE